MNKRYLKRLTNLARIARDAQKAESLLSKVRRFTMHRWGYGADKGETCGTPACLLGHYAARIDVQRRFSLRKDGEVRTHGKGRYANSLIQRAADHFGITFDDAHAMFGNSQAPGANQAKSPAGAAQYVERFIERIQKTA